MLEPGSLLKFDWFQTPEGLDTLQCLMQRNGQKRRTFGLLEQPGFPPSLMREEVHYKLMLVGKSGVGKTSTVAKLSGHEIPSSHGETAGLQTTVIYWPAKIIQLNKTVVFRLTFWDAGETAMKKFDHIFPACTEKLDGILFLFSFVDKSSFDEIPQMITRFANPDDNVSKLVIGTKFDLHAHSEITQRDIRDFEANWKIPILKIKNVPEYHHTETRNEMSDIIPILNSICEHLWYKDLVTAGRRSRSAPSTPSDGVAYL